MSVSGKAIFIKNDINLYLPHRNDSALSRLFFAPDAIIFAYRVTSISGLLFDVLAHDSLS
jgi:hypothetical protein